MQVLKEGLLRSIEGVQDATFKVIYPSIIIFYFILQNIRCAQQFLGSSS